MPALEEPTMEDLLLLEEFDPFTPKRPLVASLHLDTEKESDTGHHSRMTTERPYLDDPATTTCTRNFLGSLIHGMTKMVKVTCSY